MKRKTSILMAAMMSVAGLAYGADAGALWKTNCASCHGADGSGGTTMGKKLGVKNYTDAKVQSAMSDAEMTKAISNGQGKMKGFKGKLSDADIKALVSYVRSLKK
jgi:mono/diheme cytochrome c family protein